MTPCIEWWGTISTQGYGVTTHRGKQYKAHRWVYIVCFGPLPEDTPLVLHHCDNRVCVNPEHLYAGTHEDNMRDMRERRRASRQGAPRRTECSRGHALTPENTRVSKRTRGGVLRTCLTCQRERWRRDARKQREKVN